MGKRLKIRHGATEEYCIGKLKRQFVHPTPELQKKILSSPAQAEGAVVLAWQRGCYAGTHDAYLTLREAYPEAAQALLDAWNMDEHGVITGGR